VLLTAGRFTCTANSHVPAITVQQHQQQLSKKLPKSTGEDSLIKWQSERDKTTKGQITKLFFPVIRDRLKMKIKISPIFTTMITGHGNLKSYLHKFKIIESPTCPCGKAEQTIDHLLFQCELLG
jgi:hypothetical protein